MVSYKYVFRKNSGTLTYALDTIKAEEELYFAVFGEENILFLENEYQTLKNRFQELLKILEEEERELITATFGFGEKKYSVKEYANEIGISEKSVIYRRDKALRKLKNPFFNQKLRSNYGLIEGMYSKKYNFVDWKSIILDDIKARIFGVEGNVSFLDSIFEKCRISVEIEDFQDIMVHINQLDLSPRSYTALLKAGITTIGDLLNIFDSLSEINDLGIMSYNEILTKLRDFNYKNSVKCTVRIGEKESIFDLKCSSFQQMAEQIYNFINGESPVLQLLTEYELSIGLSSYLLSKGYLFLNVLYEERYLILQELDYVKLEVLKKELLQFLEWIQLRYNEELHCVSVMLISNALAERLIRKQPVNYKEMIKCCSGKEETFCKFYKEFFEACMEKKTEIILYKKPETEGGHETNNRITEEELCY